MHALHVETSVSRPGRRFEPIRERELHADALSAAEGIPGAARGLIVVPEFAGPIGIPDFTAFVGNVAALRARQALAVTSVINEIDAGILAAAHVRRASSVADLAGALGWPSTTILPRMRKLTTTGAIIEVNRDRYVRHPEIQPQGRLYAIEAKVEDWRAALRQARTYQVWADAYVIVMTGLSARTQESLLTEVRRDRGGLVVDGRWVTRPRLASVAAHRQLQAAEMFAAATRAGLQRPPF